jgi:hypothetical protein
MKPASIAAATATATAPTTQATTQATTQPTTKTTATTPNNAGFGSSPPAVPVLLHAREPSSPPPPHSSCPSCLYTGVSLCGAMTTYFAYQALDPALVAKSRYNKPIFLAVAGVWAVAGIYRYSLGWCKERRMLGSTSYSRRQQAGQTGYCHAKPPAKDLADLLVISENKHTVDQVNDGRYRPVVWHVNPANQACLCWTSSHKHKQHPQRPKKGQVKHAGKMNSIAKTRENTSHMVCWWSLRTENVGSEHMLYLFSASNDAAQSW